MSAAEIEEMNRLRKSMGLAPLPVPGGGGSDGGNLQFKEKDADVGEDEEPASTLETREAAAYDNYKKLQDEEEAKKAREKRLAAIKKARDAAKRSEVLEGKGLGEADDNDNMSAKAWLKSQTKRQKQIEKARKYEEKIAAEEAERAAAIQYTSKDLAGVKVAHELGAFEDGDEHIMTLKDSNVLGDEDDDGDQLEDVNLRDREKLTEKLELKKKKPIYDPHAIDETGERSILAQYDEEISGKKAKQFTLDAQGNTVMADSSGAQPQGRQLQKISLDFLEEDRPSSDYLDISEVKVKKPKKKKSKSTRQRPVDEDDIFPTEPTQDQSMDIDSGAGFVSRKRKTEDTSYADDEDLQATLAMQRRQALKKRKRVRPEDIARQLKEESATPGPDDSGDARDAGLVIDETSEFVSSLRKEDVEDRKPRKRTTASAEPVTAMGGESDEDETMQDGYGAGEETHQHEESALPEASALGGVDEEKTVGAGAGLGATLQLLKERRLIAESNAGDLNTKFRDQQAFLAEKKRRLEEIEKAARDQRERDRASGRFSKMSAREREDYARQQNNMRDQQTSRIMADLFSKGYQPNVELRYHDEFGRSLDQKEAFKHLSHQFHGMSFLHVHTIVPFILNSLLTTLQARALARGRLTSGSRRSTTRSEDWQRVCWTPARTSA